MVCLSSSGSSPICSVVTQLSPRETAPLSSDSQKIDLSNELDYNDTGL